MSAGQDSSIRAILYAFLANFVIALAKSVAAFYTGSGSMLAEAIHSYADSGNQVLLYLGLRQSQKPPNAEHPLGYGKVTYFWSFLVGLLLFSLGGLFSIYEGWHKLHAPEPLSYVWVALVVLGLALVLEGFSLFGCLREINKLRGANPFWSWLKETRNAELVVVLGEDVAALIGLAVAFTFLLLAYLTGDPIYDAIGSICIGVILLVISVLIVLRIKTLIVGRSAEPGLQSAIAEIIREEEGIVEVLNTITMQFGHDVMLAAKLRMAPGISIEQAVEHINRLERKIKEQYPVVKWCFMEPDNQK